MDEHQGDPMAREPDEAAHPLREEHADEERAPASSQGDQPDRERRDRPREGQEADRSGSEPYPG